MRERQSEIFNEFANIAVKQGLIDPVVKIAEVTNPRYDSLDLKAIQMLYGISPDGEQKHIMEQAHPKTVVVSPAYDRVNGMFPSELEHQDIMHFVATKPTHGKPIHERYVKAKQELLNKLIRTAFILDSANKPDLMNLADNCAERLTKTAWTWKDLIVGSGSILGPVALVGFGWWGAAAGAVALGVIAAVNNFGGMVDQGASANAQKAIEELQDIIEDAEEGKGFESQVQAMIADLNFFLETHSSVDSFNIDPRAPQDEIASATNSGKTALVKYKKAATGLMNRVPKWLSLLNALQECNDAAQESESSILSGIYDLAEYIWTPDVKDAIVALQTLQKSLTDSIEAMTKLYNTVVVSARDELASLEKENATETTDEEAPPESMVRPKTSPSLQEESSTPEESTPSEEELEKLLAS